MPTGPAAVAAGAVISLLALAPGTAATITTLCVHVYMHVLLLILLPSATCQVATCRPMPGPAARLAWLSSLLLTVLSCTGCSALVTATRRQPACWASFVSRAGEWCSGSVTKIQTTRTWRQTSTSTQPAASAASSAATPVTSASAELQRRYADACSGAVPSSNDPEHCYNVADVLRIAEPGVAGRLGLLAAQVRDPQGRAAASPRLRRLQGVAGQWHVRRRTHHRLSLCGTDGHDCPDDDACGERGC
jgi:hypothetical protein